MNPNDLDHQQDQGNSSIWRILAAVVALGIIIILVYPFIRQRTSVESGQSTSPLPSPTPSLVLTTPVEPDDAKSQFNQGNEYVQLGQWELAIEAYQKAVELDPEYQAAYANLGVAYYQNQQLDQAVIQYQKALELDPEDGEVAYNLGALYLQKALSSGSELDPEYLQRAITQITHAMELNPDLAPPHFSLGVAHMYAGDFEAAAQSFETFLELNAGEDPTAEQRAKLYLQQLQEQ